MVGSKLMDTLEQLAVDIFAREGLRQKLAEGRPLRVKFGADPSRPDLHLGHSVPLRMLRRLQDAGHEIIFVIGDFTGMIGDPSGRSKSRVPLTFEQTRENGRSYFEQVAKILDVSKARVEYNSSWLGAMSFSDVLSLAGKYTLARVLGREDFARRFEEKRPIGLHELLYPLMQGYDSVALHADIEIGGTDQTFNLLVGRELQKDYGQERQEVITFPLLPGLDGVEKMSKSLDNYIGIDEPADVMFEKCMRVPDSVLADYFRLTTDIDKLQYEEAMRRDIRAAHRLYAREILCMYHGEKSVEAAELRYDSVAGGAAPENMESLCIDAASMPLAEVLKLTGFAQSGSQARRLVEGGGIKVNGQTAVDAYIALSGEAVISRGKNRFVKVRFKG
ncbi:MAG: tyrosine--tRNA ligase [Aminipila sp.]